VVVLLGCSAPATLPQLAAADRAADAGDVATAVADYRQAQVACHRIKSKRRARQACGEALLGEGQVLADAGKTQPAIDAYLAIPTRVLDDPTTAATALYRAGELELRAQQIVPAWTHLWKVVTDYPDEPVAGDALHDLVADGRTRNARALADQLAKLLTALSETGVADNLLWWLADLDAHELANLPAARALYDRIPVDYPKSGLRDDARWYAAQLSLALHDPQGCVTRLRALLSTREVAWGPGSYFSIWLDDAQLLLGQVLRDQLHDLRGAAAAFRRLPKDYPSSTLRDDALYELAVTLHEANDRAGACKALRDLHALEPDSKYAARAAELGKELACG
jgi:tetratricopeptide (TPR) repeat protein